MIALFIHSRAAAIGLMPRTPYGVAQAAMDARSYDRESMKELATITVVLTSAFLCSTAVAETSEERNACIGDAFRVCWSAIPNRNEVFVCLLENRSQLNPACRAIMIQYVRPHRITRPHRRTRVE